jgi:uncharacterized protein
MIRIEDARAYYNDDPVHGFDHILRVLALAEHIARAEGADVEIVRAAALLHDIARDADDDEAGQQDHAALAAERARAILADQPLERVEAVCQAIASHRFRAGPPPATLEARVLFDADKLDAIGATGIARAFAYAGQHGQPLFEQPGDARHSSIHEFRQKLSLLRDRMTTATGRALAQERHAFMEAFFERLAAELRGEA